MLFIVMHLKSVTFSLPAELSGSHRVYCRSNGMGDAPAGPRVAVVGGKRKAQESMTADGPKKGKAELPSITTEVDHATFELYWTNGANGSKPRPVLKTNGRFPKLVALATDNEELTPIESNPTEADLKGPNGSISKWAHTIAAVPWSANDAKEFISLSIQFTRDKAPVLCMPTRSGVVYVRFHMAGVSSRRRCGLVQPAELIPDEHASLPTLRASAPVEWLPPLKLATVAHAAFAEPSTPTTPPALLSDAVTSLDADADAAVEEYTA
jgi:hypothetical protein